MPDDTCLKCFHPVKPAAQFCENCGARTGIGAATGQSGSGAETRVIVAEGSLFGTIISAGLFIWVGFFMGWDPPAEHPVFDASVPVWVWGTRSIGIGLLLVAAMTYMRIGSVVYLDALISIAAAAICLGVGAIWLYFGYQSEGLLILIFGLFNSRAAIHAARQLTRMMSAPGGG